MDYCGPPHQIPGQDLTETRPLTESAMAHPKLNLEENHFGDFKFLGTSNGGAMPLDEQERVRRNFSAVALIVLGLLPSCSCASGFCNWCRVNTCASARNKTASAS